NDAEKCTSVLNHVGSAYLTLALLTSVDERKSSVPGLLKVDLDIPGSLKLFSRGLGQEGYKETRTKILSALLSTPFVEKLTQYFSQCYFHDSLDAEVLHGIIDGGIVFLNEVLNLCPKEISSIEDCYGALLKVGVSRNILTSVIANQLRDHFDEVKKGSYRAGNGACDSFFRLSDFRRCSVIPLHVELLSRRNPPVKRSEVFGPYRDSEKYLSTHFCLVREDYQSYFRAVLIEVAGAIAKRKRIPIQLPNAYVFHNCYVAFVSLDEEHGLVYALKIPLLSQLSSRFELMKRVPCGSLLVLTADCFARSMIASVVSVPSKSGTWDIVMIRPESEVTDLFAWISMEFIVVSYLVEFKLHRGVMESLRCIHLDAYPMAKFIVFSMKRSVEMPMYLREAAVKHTADVPLKHICGEDLIASPSENWWFSAQEIGLDEGQFQALKAGISKEISLIGGPPGTGKTTVGQMIVRTIIERRKAFSIKQEGVILVISASDQALDNFLKGLSTSSSKIMRHDDRKTGSTKGSHNSERDRSFTDLTENTRRKLNESVKNLRTLFAGEAVLRASVLAEVSELEIDFHAGFEVADWLGMLEEVNSDSLFLLRNAVGIKEASLEISEKEIDGDEMEMSSKVSNSEKLETSRKGIKNDRCCTAVESHAPPDDEKEFFEVSVSSTGNHILAKNLILHRHLLSPCTKADSTKSQSLFSRACEKKTLLLEPELRWTLYRHWVTSFVSQRLEETQALLEEFECARKLHNELHNLEILSRAEKCDVFGITVCDAVENIEIVRNLRARVVIVDEAAEILEAALVSVLSRHCEHLVLLGDTQQSMPKTINPDLAKESKLDVSLFHRLLWNGFPCLYLSVQHRLRPDLLRLMQPLLGSTLTSVVGKHFEDVRGIRKNVFFVSVSRSKNSRNRLESSFEQEFILALCQHLLYHGYSQDQITILVSSECQVLPIIQLMKRFSACVGVRICPLESYRGLENDIILLSLDRCDNDPVAGAEMKAKSVLSFCLSRARLGLYMIGDMRHLSFHSKAWKRVQDVLKFHGELGPGLPVLCHMNPDHKITVHSASDFPGKNGCKKNCGMILCCGQKCTRLCNNHEDVVHCEVCGRDSESVFSHRPAEVIGSVPNMDAVETQVVLQTPVLEPLKKTDAAGASLHKCEESGRLMGQDDFKCDAMVEHPCGHALYFPCYVLPSVADLSGELLMDLCDEPCNAVLPCGHECTGNCRKCWRGRIHEPCSEPCVRVLVCGHECRALCCELCPPCEQDCSNLCEHSRCAKKCGEPCDPCEEMSAATCSDCPKNSCELFLDCSKNCESVLLCGHKCIGICGELCPPCWFCNNELFCKYGNVEEFGTPKTRLIGIPECGHVVSEEDFNEILKEGSQIVHPAKCPEPWCQNPLFRVRKYRRTASKFFDELARIRLCVTGKSNVENELEEIVNFLTESSIDDETCGSLIINELGLEKRMSAFLCELGLTFCEPFFRRGVAVEHVEQATIFNAIRARDALNRLKLIHDLALLHRTGCDAAGLTFARDSRLISEILQNYPDVAEMVECIEAKTILEETSMFSLDEEDSVKQLIQKAIQERNISSTMLPGSRTPLVIISVNQGDWIRCPVGHIFCVTAIANWNATSAGITNGDETVSVAEKTDGEKWEEILAKSLRGFMEDMVAVKKSVELLRRRLDKIEEARMSRVCCCEGKPPLKTRSYSASSSPSSSVKHQGLTYCRESMLAIRESRFCTSFPSFLEELQGSNSFPLKGSFLKLQLNAPVVVHHDFTPHFIKDSDVLLMRGKKGSNNRRVRMPLTEFDKVSTETLIEEAVEKALLRALSHTCQKIEQSIAGIIDRKIKEIVIPRVAKIEELLDSVGKYFHRREERHERRTKSESSFNDSRRDAENCRISNDYQQFPTMTTATSSTTKVKRNKLTRKSKKPIQPCDISTPFNFQQVWKIESDDLKPRSQRNLPNCDPKSAEDEIQDPTNEALQSDFSGPRAAVGNPVEDSDSSDLSDKLNSGDATQGSTTMDGDCRIVDYFIVAGLPSTKDPKPLGEVDVHDEGVPKSCPSFAEPITDIQVINRTENEDTPPGFYCIEKTPQGWRICFSANLNHGSFRSPELYLCYRRGRDRPPLLDIWVLFEGKDDLMPDSQVLERTPNGHMANVNNASVKTFMSYRRAKEEAPCNELVVTDICVILPKMGERPPHCFYRIDRNLNRGMIGSDVYVCYKKSMNRPNLVIYEPEIIWRYPVEDYDDCPLPPSIATFGLPLGATLEWWPPKARAPKPVFSTFVLSLTNAHSEGSVKSWYGAAVAFYEEHPAEKVTHEQRKLLSYPEQSDPLQLRVFAKKCICFLSHWPFFDAYQKFLMFLHRFAFSGEAHPIPIERHLSHFMHFVPFPSLQRPFVFAQLSATERLSLYLPPDSPLRQSGAKFRDLLDCLDAERIVQVLVMTLLEQKILLHSLRPNVLTSVAEALSMVIFPFQWQCPYIPLCPLGLANVLSAPMPFLVGVDSRYFDLYDPPDGVICVDLDTDSLRIPPDKEWMSAKALPKKCVKMLISLLKQLTYRVRVIQREERCQQNVHDKNPAGFSDADSDMKWKQKEMTLEMDIQEAFLYFMAGILKGYQHYLTPVSSEPKMWASDPADLFESPAFLRSRDKAYHAFYSILVETQLFTHFIQERSFTSSKDASLAFFDVIMDKLGQEEDAPVKLLERDSPQNQMAAMILPLEREDLPEGISYTYNGIDKLNLCLMKRPKITSHLHNFKDNAVDGLVNYLPGASPMIARRIKHEIRLAQKIVKKHADGDSTWAKALLSCSISIWFAHLPSYIIWYKGDKLDVLEKAYEKLVFVQKTKLKWIDEVWFRVMMQLCNQYKEGRMAVKVFSLMKELRVGVNALTYGLYNRAMLDARWNTSMSDRASARAWRKLRNIVWAIAYMKTAAHAKAERKSSLSSEGNDGGTSCESPHRSNSSVEAVCSSKGADDLHTTPVKGKKTFLFRSQRHNSASEKSNQTKTGHKSKFSRMLNADDEDKEEPDPEDDPVLLELEHKDCPIYEDEKIVEDVVVLPDKTRADSLSSVEEFKAQAAMTGQMMMTWGAKLIQGSSDLVEKTKKRLGQPGSLSSSSSVDDPDVSSRADSKNLELKNEETSSVSPTIEKHEVFEKDGGASLVTIEKEEEEDKEVVSAHEAEEKLDGTLQSSTHLTPPDAKKRSVSPMARSPTRTPVTENDPLGALRTPETLTTPTAATPLTASSSHNSLPANVFLSPELRPSARQRVTLASSDKLALSLSSLSTQLRKSVRLGKTLGMAKSPAGAAPSTVARQLLSPQADLHRCNTHLGLVDSGAGNSNAGVKAGLTRGEGIAGRAWSGTPLGKNGDFKGSSSELFSGMSSSLRTAASSISKRLDSFMDAVNFSPPPSSLSSFRHSGVYASSQEDGDLSESERMRGSQDSLQRGTPKRDSDSQSQTSLNLNGSSTKASSPGVDPFMKSSPFAGMLARHLATGPVALAIRMYSCGTCHGCKAMMYDEEIMSGWSPEDSNLNTRFVFLCSHCGHSEVPQLTVMIRDFRTRALPEDSESVPNTEEEKYEGLAVDPVVVPYLSPLVLRKQLEFVLESEGDSCLLEPAFVDQHSIIYWNMVWYFLRIHAPSHLPGLALGATVIRPVSKQFSLHPSWEKATASNVEVKCYWDEPGLHGVESSPEDVDKLWMMPLYLSWRSTRSSPAQVLTAPDDVTHVAVYNLSKQVLAGIMSENKLLHPVELILTELRSKWDVEKYGPPNSVYREILFLAFVHCGFQVIDIWPFDREYRRAYESLRQPISAKLTKLDAPPSYKTMLCQRSFAQLLLPSGIQ
ncbi:unnamed protein product, partial [Notodromas monacha]